MLPALFRRSRRPFRRYKTRSKVSEGGNIRADDGGRRQGDRGRFITTSSAQSRLDQLSILDLAQRERSETRKTLVCCGCQAEYNADATSCVIFNLDGLAFV